MAHQINIKNLSISVSPNIFCEEIDQGYFLLDSESGEYYEFTGVAAIIWKIIHSNKDKTSASSLISSLSKDFNSNPEIELDVENFLNELIELKIILISEQ